MNFKIEFIGNMCRPTTTLKEQLIDSQVTNTISPGENSNTEPVNTALGWLNITNLENTSSTEEDILNCKL